MLRVDFTLLLTRLQCVNKRVCYAFQMAIYTDLGILIRTEIHILFDRFGSLMKIDIVIIHSVVGVDYITYIVLGFGCICMFNRIFIHFK